MQDPQILVPALGLLTGSLVISEQETHRGENPCVLGLQEDLCVTTTTLLQDIHVLDRQRVTVVSTEWRRILILDLWRAKSEALAKSS